MGKWILERDMYTTIRPFAHGRAHKLLCLKLDGYIGETVRLYGEYSEAEVDVFRRFVRASDVVIDAGALFGEHTLALAELCPRGSVLAFEPQRIPFQILCGNVQLNSMDNVDAAKCALGADDGVTKIMPLDPRRESPWGLTSPQLVTDGDAVRVRTIDGLFLGRLDFIKIDVEGFEAQVLEGGRKTIERHQPVIYLEFNANREPLLSMLIGMGYKSWRHFAPVDREPNFLGCPVDREQTPRPSDMVLAVPPARLADEADYGFEAWLHSHGFTVPLDDPRGGPVLR